MNRVWIEHNGYPITIDPKDGYEAVRGITRSLIVMYSDRRERLLVRVKRNNCSPATTPVNGKLVISGFINDYFVVTV